MFSTQSSGAVNAAVNAVSNVATGTANVVSDVATGTANVVSNATSGAVNAAANLFQSVNKAANTAVNAVSQAMPSFNSLLPIGNISSGATNAPANRPPNAPANALANAPANRPPNANAPANAPPNNSRNAYNVRNNIGNVLNAVANTNPGGIWSWFTPLNIFAVLFFIFIIIYYFLGEQIDDSYNYTVSSIKKFVHKINKYFKKLAGAKDEVLPPPPPPLPPPPPPDEVHEVHEVTVAPQAPQDMTPDEQRHHNTVEKILPSSGQEVFNVAQNKFTYYDAEPLCQSLGAELATYEQVKDAWEKGADWCNYGWVKGQMAVYPTQDETYHKLQMGPKSDRRACGTVGINGGYFDNPEFKYGVNCYGKKPKQSAHDEQLLMSEGKVPKSQDSLQFDKLVNEFKDDADTLYVKPFNNDKWVSA